MGSEAIAQVFEDNYDKFKGSLKRRFVSLNDYDIEDIVQQSAMNLLARADVAGISNLTSYIYRTLHNGAKDYFKKNSRETLAEVEPEPSTESTEGQLIAKELKDAVMKAIATLDEKHRYVYVQTQFKGKSYEELAKETGEKLGTLLSRKSRAVKKIKEFISDYLEEE